MVQQRLAVDRPIAAEEMLPLKNNMYIYILFQDISTFLLWLLSFMYDDKEDTVLY